MEFEPEQQAVTEANELVSEIRDSSEILPEDKRTLMGEWAVVMHEQEGIVAAQEAIIAQWRALDVDRKFDSFVEAYWALDARARNLNARGESYKVYCSRQVPPDQLEAAIRECQEIKAKLDADWEDFVADNRANENFHEETIRQPILSINEQIAANNTTYTAWLSRLKSFNEVARERLRSRGKASYISIHVQPEGRQGSGVWIAGKTQVNSTRISAETLLDSVSAQTAAALGNRRPNLKGFEGAVTKVRTVLQTHAQPNGRTPWSYPFGDRGQFRLDLEINGEYPYTGGNP